MGEISGLLERSREKTDDGAKWANFGKQNWRCGMNQTPG
jgi:hypothetical protein